MSERQQLNTTIYMSNMNENRKLFYLDRSIKNVKLKSFVYLSTTTHTSSTHLRGSWNMDCNAGRHDKLSREIQLTRIFLYESRIDK